MNHTQSSALKEQHIQWLSVLAFMYTQQNQHQKALPLLTFLHDHHIFKMSISIQFIQCLQSLEKFEHANNIINSSLKNTLPDDHRAIIETLKKLNTLLSNNKKTNKSISLHE